MTASYCRRGEVLEYTPTEPVEAGQAVVLGSRIGVAAEDIAAGQTGHVHVAGVFAMPKAAGEAVAQGAALYYDGSEDVITSSPSAGAAEGEAGKTADRVPAGYAAAGAGAADAAVQVKLLG